MDFTLTLFGLILLFSIVVAIYEVIRSDHGAYKIVGIQLASSSFVAMAVLITILADSPAYLDVALSLAVLGSVMIGVLSQRVKHDF